MIRVLQVVTDTDRRGAQVFASDLRDELVRQGDQVRTVALIDGRVGGQDLPIMGTSRRDPSLYRRLRREMADVDVVAGHGSHTLPACAIASTGAKTPFVYRQISDSLFWAPTRMRRMRVSYAMRRAERVVALWSGSAATLRDHFGVATAKIDVIPNGVPPNRFLPVDESERAAARARVGLDPEMSTIAYVGALAREKGVDLVVEAMADLREAQLVVAGDGPESEHLKAAASKVAPNRIVFTGSLEDPKDAYAAADVIALASRGGDSMPAVLIEAGLMGIPAVATAVEAIPEIVRDGETGLICSIDDVPAGLAKLLDDPSGARRMGEAARLHCVSSYGIQAVAAAWHETLEHAAAR